MEEGIGRIGVGSCWWVL